jgi:hypothetical protein
MHVLWRGSGRHYVEKMQCSPSNKKLLVFDPNRSVSPHSLSLASLLRTNKQEDFPLLVDPVQYHGWVVGMNPFLQSDKSRAG